MKEKLDSPLRGSFRIPFVLFLILTPIFLLLGFLSAGAGHGNYLMTKILFPFMMLSTVVSSEITLPFVVLGVLQFPFYGLLVGLANQKRKLGVAMLAVSAVHLLVVFICFAFADGSFS